MTKRQGSSVNCSICGRSRPRGELTAGATVREPVVAEIRREQPDWMADQPICFDCLNRFRAEHFRRLLQEEKGELSSLEEQVLHSVQEQESVSSNVNEQFDLQLTIGERLSDRLADFGGSWSFLIIFGLVLVLWLTINTVVLAQRTFDPYPFILLNLVLSCLAAVQAPIILMSQKRLEAKDRLRSEHDYRVNLKAELEIQLLHAKLDQLLSHQWQRLLEIQELQMDLMEEVANRRPTGRSESPTLHKPGKGAD
jgi:uncharacterized membrane protein